MSKAKIKYVIRWSDGNRNWTYAYYESGKRTSFCIAALPDSVSNFMKTVKKITKYNSIVKMSETIYGDAYVEAEIDLNRFLSEEAKRKYNIKCSYRFCKIDTGEYFCEDDNQVYTLPEIEQLMLDL